ncbi:MAG: polysialyltransferase family glycosyltransferase [Nostocales cyanobacterium 94392]|nr:polysialyltransferase family glycosyltransferase [Nostocales cyanobacterium 94392]
MTNLKLVKRIITCQGSIQLVTALSVLNYRGKEQKNLNQHYEDYLVIYDLYTPPGQIEEFANFIKKMAQLVHEWKAISYVNPQQIDTISNKLGSSSPKKIYDIVHQLVGTNSADEIYLCRNWQFGNQLLINTYKSAEKICYGDSIGIYFSSNAKGLFAASTPVKLNFRSYIKKKIKSVISHIKEKLQLKTVLKIVKFDIGYFMLPDIMGELPPMKTVILDKLELLTTFDQLRGLIDIDYVLQLKEKISDNPVIILLTSNFSEAQRMSEEDEINAYRQFLISQEIEPDTILIIKPHPRDGNFKIQRLQSTLTDLFANILILSEPDLFFLPFEILFAQVFRPSDMSVIDNIRVLTVSSACLSLKMLFNVPCIVGFGDKISPQFFFENYVDGRLEHEQYLKKAIEKII